MKIIYSYRPRTLSEKAILQRKSRKVISWIITLPSFICAGIYFYHYTQLQNPSDYAFLVILGIGFQAAGLATFNTIDLESHYRISKKEKVRNLAEPYSKGVYCVWVGLGLVAVGTVFYGLIPNLVLWWYLSKTLIDSPETEVC